jgi:hypothetical protein
LCCFGHGVFSSNVSITARLSRKRPRGRAVAPVTARVHRHCSHQVLALWSILSQFQTIDLFFAYAQIQISRQPRPGKSRICAGARIQARTGDILDFLDQLEILDKLDLLDQLDLLVILAILDLLDQLE